MKLQPFWTSVNGLKCFPSTSPSWAAVHIKRTNDNLAAQRNPFQKPWARVLSWSPGVNFRNCEFLKPNTQMSAIIFRVYLFLGKLFITFLGFLKGSEIFKRARYLAGWLCQCYTFYEKAVPFFSQAVIIKRIYQRGKIGTKSLSEGW